MRVRIHGMEDTQIEPSAPAYKATQDQEHFGPVKYRISYDAESVSWDEVPELAQDLRRYAMRLGAYGLEHEKPAGSRSAEYLPMKPQDFRNRELVVHIRRNGLKPGVVRIETSSFGHPVIQPKFSRRLFLWASLMIL